ncbi:MAG: hypothetical protein ABIA21_03140 [Candidatus Aenigmatarchaeota archaeon]
MSYDRMIPAVIEMHRVKEEYMDYKIDLHTAKKKIRSIAEMGCVEPKITMGILREIEN